ncbi:MAG: hypothetical protein HYR79_03215 [Nitrospirae bacterium]|nr:hypothetical protein [Nitrospirota bacterium]
MAMRHELSTPGIPDRTSHLFRWPIPVVLIPLILLSIYSPSAFPGERPFHFIRAIAIDPAASETLYAATDNQGLIKSVDGGGHWRFINTGIMDDLVYDVKISLITPRRIYAAAWGSGFYQSEDGGESWREVNAGLGNTAIGVILLQADSKGRSETITIGTSTDLYERRAEETVWRSMTGGLAFWNGPQFQSLIIGGSDPGSLWMGSESGLFQKTIGISGWRAVKPLRGIKITVLTARSKPDLLYAGTLGGGLFVSDDQGKSWVRTGIGLEKAWIRAIAIHPSDAGVIYAAASVSGIFKSRDGGKSWRVVNRGLTDQDVRALAIDPRRPEILFAGTHGAGIFKSINGGTSWRHQSGLPFLDLSRQLEFLNAQANREKPDIAAPASFRKCNHCHGWTDLNLNQKATPWRVAANRRDWKQTVARMTGGTDIRPEEEEEITRFLERFTETRVP